MRRSKKGYRQAQREDNSFTSRRLSGATYNAFYESPHNFRPSSLSLFEDRRQFHPEGSARPARSFASSRHRLRLLGVPVARAVRPSGSRYDFSSRRFVPLPYRIGFENPTRILLCVRRRVRREVLHALGVAGIGGAARKLFKRPTRNEYSSIGC